MDAMPRFRITAWPDRPLPHPHLDRLYERVALVDGALIGTLHEEPPAVRALRSQLFDAIERDAGEDELQALAARLAAHPKTTPSIPDAGETYLRLASVDLKDEQQILAFANSYGLLDARRAGMDPHPDLAYYGFVLEPGSKERIAAMEQERDELEARLAAADQLGSLGSLHETLTEFRFAASAIKDLVTAWRVVSGQIPQGDAQWVSEVWEDGRTSGPRLNSDPWEPGGPQRLLSGYLSDAMSVFTPTISFEASMPAEPGESPPLYCVLCLELFNHILDNAAYRTCANETCGRLFVRQQGRSEHGQHRASGVLYCSHSCARAQANRAYRRRRRSGRPDS